MKEIIKDMEMLHAPDGFTPRVMNRVLAESRHTSIVYKPLFRPATLFVFLSFFIGLIIISYFLTDPSATGDGSFYGLTFTLPPVHEWINSIFQPFSKLNANPLIVTVSILMLLSLILADEFILKRIFEKR